MKSTERVYFGVGIAFIAAVCALLFLSLYGSQLNVMEAHSPFYLQARFDNVSGLHVRSPIRIAGVNVGRVYSIKLDDNYQAQVVLAFDRPISVPVDSSVKVYTDGLLGGRYLSINIGFESDDLLKSGGVIEHTTSGLVLEDFLAGAVNSMRGKDA